MLAPAKNVLTRPSQSALFATGFASLPAELPLANEFKYTETAGTMTPASLQTASSLLIGPTPTGTANNGTYATGRCFSVATSTALHWAEVTAGNSASNYPRGCGVGVVGSSSTFTNGVYAVGASFVGADNWRIYSKVGNTVTQRATVNPGTTFAVGERLKLVVTHNGTNYVYSLYRTGVLVTSWTDTGGVITPGPWASVIIQGTYSGGWFAGQAVATAAYGEDGGTLPVPLSGGQGTDLTGSTSTTIDFPAPAGIAVGDILVARLYVESTATVVSTGWAEAPDSPVVNATGGSLHRLHVFWKRADASDLGATTYSFTGSTGYRSGRMFRFTGAVVSGNPWDVTNSAAAGSASTTSPAVTVTTTGANRLLVWEACDFAGGTWTQPSGYTFVDSTDGHGSGIKTQAAAGSSGSVTGTNTNSGVMSSWLGALKP